MNDLPLLSSGDFYVYARPDGERCLLTASKGQTQVKNMQGNLVMAMFQSPLPGGSSAEGGTC